MAGCATGTLHANFFSLVMFRNGLLGFHLLHSPLLGHPLITPPAMLAATFLCLRLLGLQLLGLPPLEHFLPAPPAMLEATFLHHLLLHHLLLVTPTAGTLHGNFFRLGMFRLCL